jgi:large repetitive protein
MTRTPAAPRDHHGAPNVVLSESVSPATVHPGGQVTYTLVVHNRGPGEARGVTLTDPLLSGQFFQDAHTHDGVCTIGAAGLTCHLGTLPQHGSPQVLLTATVRTDAAGILVNIATVSARPGDSQWANNTGRATLHVTAGGTAGL